MLKLSSLDDAPAILEREWPNTSTIRRQDLSFMRELMDAVGNPQDKLKIIHVAGTSGKTSTSFYAAALLHRAGKRVGLTVSPHVVLLNERVQINMQPLDEAVFCSELNEFMVLVKRSGLDPNYMDLIYAFAFWELARQRVEYAVVEVGIGGLLDATNVAGRQDKVCVLTDIGLDHTYILGDTLSKVATQKAGIIYPRNAVFCWQQTDEVINAFRAVCHQKQADFNILVRPGLGPDFAFLPSFQRRNFELALNAVQYVLKRDKAALNQTAVLSAAHTHIPARMEIFWQGNKAIILDGSHNPQKIHTLALAIKERFPGRKVAVMAGLSKSKSPENSIEARMHELMQLADHIILTSFTVRRAVAHGSLAPKQLAEACLSENYSNFEIIDNTEQAYQALLQRPEPVLLAAGSFFLLNHIRPLLTAGLGEQP